MNYFFTYFEKTFQFTIFVKGLILVQVHGFGKAAGDHARIYDTIWYTIDIAL
jgi:hypothetical protein